MPLYDTVRACTSCGQERLTNFPGHCQDCDPYASEVGVCSKCQSESYLDNAGLCNPCSHGLTPRRATRRPDRP